jgi:hypothetical protein
MTDKVCVNNLEELRILNDDSEQDKLKFEYLEYTWSTIASDGMTVVDLIANGREVPVQWSERFDYVRKVEAYRLNEFRYSWLSCSTRGVPYILFDLNSTENKWNT